MRRITAIWIILLGLAGGAAAQNISNKGKEFWAGFGHSAEMELNAWLDTPRMSLIFSTEAMAARVEVTIDGTTYREVYNVPPNTVMRSKQLPQGFRDIPATPWDAMLYTKTSAWPGGTNSEGIFSKKGIHIVSDVPIVAYGHLHSNASSAATMLMPVESWGYAYNVLSSDQLVTNFASLPRFAWLFVVANFDNTRIRINPTRRTRSGLPANTPIEVTLQKGQIYQVLAGVDNPAVTNDLIGTTVRSIANSDGVCYPVAAFIGSSGNGISCPGFTGAFPTEDVSIQQMFPISAWGRRYLTTPSSIDLSPTLHNYNFFRVMVKDPATIVKRNGVQLTGLTKNYYEFKTNTADYVEADNPVQVMQIFPSQGACNYTGEGDPEMIYISPIEQGIKRAGFLRNEKANINWNFLTLNIPTAGLASLKIDGQSNNYTIAYPNANLPGYSVVVRRWNTRSNTDPRAPAQCTVESDSAFNAITYGVGSAESYAYNAGTYINNLSGVPFIKNQYNTTDTASLFTCAKTPVQLSVLIRYKPSKIFWQFSKLTDTILPAADVTMNAPVHSAEVLIAGVPYFKYNLPGTYTFNRPGLYTIPIFATSPDVEQCDNTERLQYQVEVRDTMQTDFSMLYENCKAAELIKFNGRAKFTDSSLVQKWEWTFTNGSTTGTASGQQASYTFNAGNNSARLIAVDKYGCIADTSKNFVLSAKPATPFFDVTSTINCVNRQIQFGETNPGAGMQSWYWNFGDGKADTLTSNGHNATHVYTGHDTLVVKHMVKFSDNCMSDTAVKTIIIYANPKIDITHSGNCLPANGAINFTANATLADQQTIGSYLWNFGDAAATPSNPNTSTAANPSHIFAANNYQVQLKVVSDKGCVTDSVRNISLQPKPAISYQPALAPVCLNAATFSVAAASITNGVTGNGYYKGPGVSTNGDLNPAAAGAGTHTVWYIFNSAAGCIDSASNTIKINTVPVASFTAPVNICAGQPVHFTDQSTIDKTADANAAIQTWTWNFGDGAGDVTYSNGLPFDRPLAASSTVTLKVVSNEGCASTLFSKTLGLQQLPVVSFDLPTVICMPGGDAVFKNTSPLQAALTYNWNFGNSNTATGLNPTAQYTTANNYTVILKGTDANGCTATATKTLDATLFSNRPVAAIEVDNDKPCEGNLVLFSGKVTGSNTIAGWNWNFGDGSSATTQNPSKKYNAAGNYTVALTVTDIKGCSAATPVPKAVQVRITPKIDAGPDMMVNEGTTVVLKASATNAAQLNFSWTPAGMLNNSNILNPSYVAVSEQVFVLTATDVDGICATTDQVKVSILKPVKVPNAFSPNGDGNNDTWIIKNLADYPQSSVEIFDRFGQPVFRSQGYAKPWDGTKNGNPLPVGVYYYIIHIKQGDKPISGSITIVR